MGKNFGTTIAPWVVTMDALEQFTVPNMELKNPILDYLKHDDDYNFDIALNVAIKSKDMDDYQSVADSNFKVGETYNDFFEQKCVVHVLDCETTTCTPYDQRM